MEHPLSDFRYCPHCGSPRFVENNPLSKRCEACGFVYYPDAAAATVAVIVNDRNELLCVRRRNDPAKGTLDLPGGFVDPGESLTDGLVREVKEEVNGDVADYESLFSLPNDYLYSKHLVHTADAFFRCRLRTCDGLRPLDDAAEMLWLPLSSLRVDDFGLQSVRQGLRQLLAGAQGA